MTAPPAPDDEFPDLSYEPHVRLWWDERTARRGMERFASTADFENQAKCAGDKRFISRSISQDTINELIAICHTCPVMARCLLWAKSQILPVGFSVAGGKQWKDWTAL